MIKFKCPTCGRSMTVRDEHAGRNGKCACGAVVHIPTTGMASEKVHEKKPPQPAKTNVDLAAKYLNAEEREVSRTGKEPQAQRSGLGLVGIGVLLIAGAAFLASRSLKDDSTVYAAVAGAWGGTAMILTGLCSILSGRGPSRLPKIAYVLIGVVSLAGAIGILLAAAVAGSK